MPDHQTTMFDLSDGENQYGYPMSKQVEPKTLARSSDPETSKAAAEAIAPKVASQEEIVLRWLEDWEAEHDHAPTTWELAEHATSEYLTGSKAANANVNLRERIISRRMSGLVNKFRVDACEARLNRTEHSTATMTTWRIRK